MYRILIALLSIAIPIASGQSVPSLTNYQGRLTESNGNAVSDGTGYEIELRLWSTSTGGTTPIWGTRFTGVAVKGGALNLILGGGGTAIAGAQTTDLKAAFSGASVFLAMTVTKGATGTPIANPSEILPRQQLMSAPFAFRAESVGNDSIQKANLKAEILEALNPVGVVQAFAGITVPSGWLKCDGSAVSRTQYAALFAVIGSAHGSGDGATTFNLPDYRGRFLRGVNELAQDNGSLRDPDANNRLAMAQGGASGNWVGTVQSDAFASHTHANGVYNQLMVMDGFSTSSGGALDNINGNGSEPNLLGSRTMLTSGGAETRPKNAYVLYIIKF